MSIKWRIKEIAENIKWWFQKVFRGWSDPETWELGFTIAKFIRPRLKQFIEETQAYPPDYDSFEDYIKDLRDLYDAIVWRLDLDEIMDTTEPKQWKELYNKHYPVLKEKSHLIWELFW